MDSAPQTKRKRQRIGTHSKARVLRETYRESPTTTNVGRLIRERRKILGYSQAALAKKLEVEPMFVSEIELGRRALPPARIGQIKQILGIRGETLKDAYFMDYEIRKMKQSTWGSRKSLKKKSLRTDSA